MSTWSDIEGLTAARGAPRLPSVPSQVVAALELALSARHTRESLVNACVSAGVERARAEGLAGWLPLSHVGWWDPTSGELGWEAGSNLVDLAQRYAAWAGTRPVDGTDLPALARYAKQLVSAAAARPPRLAAYEGPERPAPRDRSAPAPLRAAPPWRDRLQALLAHLDDAFLERGAHTRAALLALLAGQHVLLLGPPGTAKSLLARALCGCFADATYFEYLLSRFTHPDELFGPVSLPGLKEEDYRRLTTGFLPQAHVAFLDEIFKANSAILNSLLTLVNERVFHHGRHRDPVPLLGLIGASNELPEQGGGLDALYDRFLVRLAVPPVAEAEHFLAVATGRLSDPTPPPELRLLASEREALARAARAVTVPESVQTALVALWRDATEGDWCVSDRRWRQAVSLLQVAAAADGREAVAPLDLLLLEPVLAMTPDLAQGVRERLVGHLGQRALPEHDLRAQWALLAGDRVAPIDGAALYPRATGSDLASALARRAESVDRFLRHHAAAVRRLGDDRARVEAEARAHLWLPGLPSALLAAHIEAARELASTLAIAEAYAADVRSPASAATARLRALPSTQRVYGATRAVTLVLADTEHAFGLNLQGERVDDDHPAPVVRVSAIELLRWLDGELSSRDLLDAKNVSPRRDAGAAMDTARALLSGLALPPPPELP